MLKIIHARTYSEVLDLREAILRLDNLAPNDRGILEESGITWADLERKLGLMDRLGINRFPDEERFVFITPAYRSPNYVNLTSIMKH